MKSVVIMSFSEMKSWRYVDPSGQTPEHKCHIPKSYPLGVIKLQALQRALHDLRGSTFENPRL